MDGYKNIIKSRNTRMKILKMLSFIPDKSMIQLQYFIKLKRKLNLKDPQRYTEKIQWYKLYYRNPLMTKCVDKFNVREYVVSKNLEHLLTKLYYVCSKPNEIDFSSLPNSFIIKTTNGSGTNIICTDKAKLNYEEVIIKLCDFMNRPKVSAGREWAYNNVENKIIIEELLHDSENRGGGN